MLNAALVSPEIIYDRSNKSCVYFEYGYGPAVAVQVEAGAKPLLGLRHAKSII